MGSKITDEEDQQTNLVYNKNYLAIISTQKDGIASGYFIDWVSAGGLIKNSKNTASFVSIIKTSF